MNLAEKIQHRLATETRFCKECNAHLPLSEFYLRIRKDHGVSVREKLCKKHHNAATVRGQHKVPANRAFMRYRANARAKGQLFEITLEQVKEWFTQSCAYCEDTSLMRTLDRVDNSLGYMPDNVVTSCIRCNLLKADMPKKAWMMLVPHLRAIRESGAFGAWVGRNFNVRKADVVT